MANRWVKGKKVTLQFKVGEKAHETIVKRTYTVEGEYPHIVHMSRMTESGAKINESFQKSELEHYVC